MRFTVRYILNRFVVNGCGCGGRSGWVTAGMRRRRGSHFVVRRRRQIGRGRDDGHHYYPVQPLGGEGVAQPSFSGAATRDSGSPRKGDVKGTGQEGSKWETKGCPPRTQDTKKGKNKKHGDVENFGMRDAGT